MLKLHIQDDEGKTTIVPLVRDEISIGRKEGNTIRLTERNVSRSHARLIRLNEGVFLEEVSARFGTRVNGDKVSGRTSVIPGDVIEIGDYRLALHVKDGAAVAPASPAPSAAEHPSGGEPKAPRQAMAVGQTEDGSTSMINLEELGEILEDDQERKIPKSEQQTLSTRSQNVKSRTFKLTRSPMVVGRTDENDIQIDHRSISRHHAKLTWSDGTYTVLDMGSANGVKVNGDFYKRADLHAGDELELGHVKMLFGAGDSAALAASAELPVAEVASSGAGRMIAIAVVLVGLLIAGAWIFHFSKTPDTGDGTGKVNATSNEKPGMQANLDRPEEPSPRPMTVQAHKRANGTANGGAARAGDGPGATKAPVENPTTNAATKIDSKAGESVKAPKNPKEAVEPGTAKPSIEPSAVKPAIEPSAVKPAVGPDAVKPARKDPGVPAVDPKQAAKAHMTNAARLLKAADFAGARKEVADAMAKDPDVQGAAELLGQIKSEQTASAALTTAQGNAQKGQWLDAYNVTKSALRDTPRDVSSFKALTTLHDRAADKLAAAAMSRGTRYYAKKRWPQAESAYRQVLSYQPGNSKAKSGLRRAQRMARKTGQHATNDNTPKEPKEPKASGDKPLSKVEQAKLLQQKARKAKYASNVPGAISYYKQCLRLAPGNRACRGDIVPLLMSTGRRCSAVKHMKRYVKSYPGASKSAQFKRLIETFEPQCN